MSCWEIFAPENAYTEEEKEQLAEAITSIYVEYAHMPEFYVVVIFHDKPSQSIYIGGKPANQFVRIRIDHIAQQMETPEARAACMTIIEEMLTPFVKDRGFDWEVHIDETPTDLWRIQGLVPPLPGSEMETLWAKENRPVPYEFAQ